MATHNTIAEIITMLEVAYRKELGKDGQYLYYQLLGDVDDGLLKAATMQHIGSSKWMPSIAELREAARALQARALGLPTPGEAWAMVLEKMGDADTYFGTPTFDDPAIAAAVAGVGWESIRHTQIDKQGVTRAHFCKEYEAQIKRQHAETMALPAVNEAVQRLAAQMGQRKQLEAKS